MFALNHYNDLKDYLIIRRVVTPTTNGGNVVFGVEKIDGYKPLIAIALNTGFDNIGWQINSMNITGDTVTLKTIYTTGSGNASAIILYIKDI